MGIFLKSAADLALAYRLTSREIFLEVSAANLV